jgi:molybdopterin-guanine dinucleotide biosynthesis protein A
MSIPTGQITALVLAGGRGVRMGGLDKGLQLLRGEPLAVHVLRRLAPQSGPVLISANRHVERYTELGATFGASVVSDSLPGFPGPLAGLLAGLRVAQTGFVLSAPCDTPNLPADLTQRLVDALEANAADIATVTTRDANGETALQPVIALLRTSLADDLAAFLTAGERKVRAWYARHKTVEVDFTDGRAFYNANSLQELADLERE